MEGGKIISIILLHGTTIENSNDIISSQTLNSSPFNVSEYLKDYFASNSLTDNELKNLNGQHVMWLGEGIYAFESTDYPLAQTWRTRYGGKNKVTKEECCVIQLSINLDDIKTKSINFSTLAGKKILNDFLNDYFDKFIQEIAKTNQNNAMKLTYLKRLALDDINNDTISKPYIIGFFIDFMKESQYDPVYSAKIIKATFSKHKYSETYICIKDKKIIQQIDLC